MAMTRAHSTSPGLQRSPSPLGMSIAKRRAQLARQIVESAISNVGRVADEVRMARMETAAMVAEAESAKGAIQSQSASFFA